MIASYLSSIADEADRRGYNFDRSKIVTELAHGTIECTEGQLDYEVQHLLKKIEKNVSRVFILACRAKSI